MKRARQQRGAVLAETAVTVVALFTLIMGIVEFGRAYSIYQDITDAAREGARYAVAPDPTTGVLPSAADVQAHVAPFFTSGAIKGGKVTMATTTHSVEGTAYSYTQVNISAPYTFFFFPFGSLTMNAHAEMRNETN